MKTKTPQSISSFRPPVVAVLGHVDHGKTSLLDFIRKTSVAAKEHGGITQHIGAYQIKIKSQKSNIKNEDAERRITFIDTPGHEAFSKMRSRGAGVADIAILVVAADDSVMPQTKESIEQIKAAGIPMIVALNKIDLPTANPDRVKQDLAKSGVQVEGFGGDVPIVPVSAKAGTGISDLLDMIVLVSDMKGLSNDQTSPFEGVVIETKIDKGKGMIASVIVKKGTLKAGMALFEGPTQIAKVRALVDDTGCHVQEVHVGDPVEILGFTSLAPIGSVLSAMPIAKAPSLAAEITEKSPDTLPDFLKPVSEQEQQKLIVVLKVDAAGSLEAIRESLDPRVQIVGMGIGDITEADILDAKASHALVIGFGVGIKSAVEKLAQTEKVVYRTYTTIYTLLEELSEVVAGLKEVLTGERELGKGQIIAEFPYEDTRVAGTKVLDGRIARGDLVKIMRDDVEISRGKVKTLRVGKEDVTKVVAGKECGVVFDKKLDFLLGDAIIAVSI